MCVGQQPSFKVANIAGGGARLLKGRGATCAGRQGGIPPDNAEACGMCFAVMEGGLCWTIDAIEIDCSGEQLCVRGQAEGGSDITLWCSRGVLVYTTQIF